MGVSRHTVLDRDHGIPMVSEVPQQCQATPIMASWPSTFLNLRCATLLQAQDVTRCHKWIFGSGMIWAMAMMPWVKMGGFQALPPLKR